MSTFRETPESIHALRLYFEAREASYQAMTQESFAHCIATSNAAQEVLRILPRPPKDWQWPADVDSYVTTAITDCLKHLDECDGVYQP